MPNKYSLVIVESPAKCKKIEEYLGPGYKCIATSGHIRELNSIENIDTENHFFPTYTIIKEKQIEQIKNAIQNAHDIYLASDNDREGEAIAYSVKEVFELPMDTKRIIFNEITEKALKSSILCPVTINMDLVHAQQARQILDILVGFKISPVLWNCITNSRRKKTALSAGRCQTPALRLIYDNDKEIKMSAPKKVYRTTGYFTNLNLPFVLSKEYEKESDTKDFLNGSIHFRHVYSCSEPIQIIREPPEPFTTSRMQQVASNVLHYSPKETMRISQLLYEKGFITYMRTDSETYSDDFIADVKEYVVKTYSHDKYIGIKDGIKGTTQNAHEAIRPTDISLVELPENIDSREKRVYRLIWENALESCMSPATFLSITATISAFSNENFIYKSEQVEFQGWTVVKKSKLATNVQNSEYSYLRVLNKGTNTDKSSIPYKKIVSHITITETKLHYTEAKLVQLLEKNGIGRPSTFSSLVDKIQERGYVKKQDVKGETLTCRDYELESNKIVEIETKREFGNEKNKLVIQPLGIIVTEFLEKHFMELFEYSYTCKIEGILDQIAKGDKVWYELCKECNETIEELIDKSSKKKIEYKIDDTHTYIVGKYGPVIKCTEESTDGKQRTTFKPVKQDVKIDAETIAFCSIEDLIDTTLSVKNIKDVLGNYEGNDVMLKKGKYGLYVVWGDKSKTLKELGNRPIENITFEEVKPFLDKMNEGRIINASMSIRKGNKGDYLFYKTARMKKPQFYDIQTFAKDTNEDYRICDKNILESWIKEKYNIN